MAHSFVISAAVADLRRTPETFLGLNYEHEEKRETQLLFGERIEILAHLDQWLHIHALEQIYFHEERGWVPHTGWILASEAKKTTSFSQPSFAVCTPKADFNGKTLSYGTLLPYHTSLSSNLRPLPQIPNRATIIEDAHQFLGLPYLWGGRAFQLPNVISSVDCSGLINLLYRANGLCIPRNSHDQYLKCRPTSKLQPGDPLYLAKEKRICHVILKINGTQFIESPESGKNIRILNWGTEIWETNGRIYFYDRPYSFIPFPGSFFS